MINTFAVIKHSSSSSSSIAYIVVPRSTQQVRRLSRLEIGRPSKPRWTEARNSFRRAASMETIIYIGVILGVYRHNGKENGNCHIIGGLYRVYIGAFSG